MKMHIFSVAIISLCMASTIVSGSDTVDTPGANTTADTNTTLTANSTSNSTSRAASADGPGFGFGQIMRCFVACRFGFSSAECNCDATCETLPSCREGKICKMIRGQFPKCVKDNAGRRKKGRGKFKPPGIARNRGRSGRRGKAFGRPNFLNFFLP